MAEPTCNTACPYSRSPLTLLDLSMNGLGDEAGVRLGESLGTRGAGANGNQGSFLNL